MGENQGLVWIIIGVLVIAAAVIALGKSMKSTMGDTQSAMEDVSGSALAEITGA